MTAPVKQVNGRPVSLVKIHQARPTTSPVASPKPAKPQAPPRPSSWRRTARVVRETGWPATVTGGRFVVRHGLYLAGGTRIVWRRGWDSRTSARYERMIRAAEAAGNAELAQIWEERGRTERDARHRRRMDLLKAPEQLALSVRNGGLAVIGLMGALGILLAVAEEDPGQFLAPWRALADLVRLLAVIAAVVWDVRYLLIAAAVSASLLAVWNVGRKQQTAPTWALPSAERRSESEPVTPARVVLALRHLGIPALKKAILQMEDGGAAMLSPIVIAGCGVELDVSLPLEVSTEEIQAKRKKLAENLGRHEHELHIVIPKAARTVRLWIADSGALDEPVGPSPLVTDPDITADYRYGRAPWGLDLRGDPALVSLYQMMLLVTGLSNQGKTAALRALALWLAFDPRVEFRIGDLKGIGDWRMFLGIATVLIEGPTDDHVMAVTHMVEAAFEEMNRRLTSGETDFPPLVIIVDEAQVAYGSAAVGPDKRPYGGDKNTSRYFRAVKGIHDQGRAVNVTIWEGTQDPTNRNLPERSRNGNHIRASLVVGTESKAAMALGEAPVEAGAAPHKLRQGKDKGTLVVIGEGVDIPAGQPSITVRTHYIDTGTAAEVAERVKARRTGVATRSAAEAVETRDELYDLSVVILPDEVRVHTPEVIHRLKNLDGAYYRDWDGGRLRRLLTDHGEDTNVYVGKPVVHRKRVMRALQEREEGPERIR